MRRSITDNQVPSATTGHNLPATAVIKSRLPLPRLFEVRAMNTRAGRERYAAGFGDARGPDRRPKAAVLQFRSRTGA
jgi:hypothetical protein